MLMMINIFLVLFFSNVFFWHYIWCYYQFCIWTNLEVVCSVFAFWQVFSSLEAIYWHPYVVIIIFNYYIILTYLIFKWLTRKIKYKLKIQFNLLAFLQNDTTRCTFLWFSVQKTCWILILVIIFVGFFFL